MHNINGGKKGMKLFMGKNKFNLKLKEDTTKYGEFICSCYKWLPLDEQKKQARRLENITKPR